MLLLDETAEIVEVFCEHHEDVLVKHSDGKFTGVQVKTRDNDQPLWKTSDDAIRGSLARFAKLEYSFPGKFKRFELATNHPCHHAENGKSLPFILATVVGAETFDALSGQAKILARRVARSAGVPELTAFAALKKTALNDGLPKLGDAGVRLESALGASWPNADGLPRRALARAATELRRECADASAMLHVDAATQVYLSTNGTTADEQHWRSVAGKRFDRDRVLALLTAVAGEPPLLAGDPAEVTIPGSVSSALLNLKLEAGGLSDVLVMNANNLRDKAEYQGTLLMRKFGTHEGLSRYDHLRSIAQNEAAMSFEQTRLAGDPFGREMLRDLDARVRARVDDRADVYDLTAEHLLGMVYALTAECKVRWSVSTPWEGT